MLDGENVRLAASMLAGVAVAAQGIGSLVGVERIGVAPATAVCLAGVGAAVVALGARRIRLGQLLAFGTAVFALASLLGHVYRLGLPPAPGPEGMPPAAAAGLVLLGAGTLALRPDRGYVAVVTARTVGGDMARRFLPGAVAIPLVLGSVGLLGVGRDVQTALATAVVATMAALCVLVWRNAHVLTRLEDARHSAVRDLAGEQRLTAQLQELDAMKNELIGIIAHDLRSPVFAIRNLADVLLESWEGMPETRRREVVRSVGDTAERMADLVNDVLDVARLELGQMPVEAKSFDLVALVRQAASETQTAYGRRCSVVVPETMEPAFGDEQLQWRVLTNVLSNAVKFTPEGSPIELELRPAAGAVEVSVRDHGTGIAPEHLPLLFEKFSRVPGESASGSGLGLFICRALVEAQGGRMIAESEPGRGSVFRWTVPTARAR